MGNWGWRRAIPWIEKAVPFLGMLATVIFLALNLIISKAAISNGTSFYVLSSYSHATAAVVLLPCGLLFQRSKLPAITTFPILCRVFLLAVLGCVGDIASYAGVNKSSATLGSEMLNLVPGFTYILAIIFRMERFNVRRVSDMAKSFGTVALITGASIVTLYRGPAVLKEGFKAVQHDWIIGGILFATAALAVAAWSIYQASILKMCPPESEMIVVVVYCIFVTVESTAVALVAERDSNAWKLQADIGLAAVLYAGIINIACRICILTWCLSKTGPLFVSMFNPLTVVFSALFGVIFFHEVLYLGSVVGTIVLVIGFYAVIWGKGEDYNRNKETMVVSIDDESTSSGAPLLQEQSSNTEQA